MSLIEDMGVAGNSSTEPVAEASPELISHIEEVFSRDDGNSAEDTTAADVAAERPAVSAKETARRASVAQEEKDELEQEGVLEDGETVEPEAEVETGEDVAIPAEEAAVESAVDPNHRFAAQQFGWTDEQIDSFAKANPELAASTFTNLLGAFTNLSRQAMPATAQRLPQQQQTTQPQAPVSRLDTLYANLKNFAEENGDTMVEQLLKPLHEEVIIPFRQIQAELAVAKTQAVRSEVNTVVADLAKQFPTVYGSEKTTLVQQQTRQQLYQMADQFRAGANLQGKEMSVSDALKRAHLVLTADQRIAEGRKQVVQQVQKRNKSITARPTQRRTPSAMGVSKGNDAAAEAYERRAHELGIEI